MSQPETSTAVTQAVISYVLRQRSEALPRLLEGLEALLDVPADQVHGVLASGRSRVPLAVVLEMLRRAREDICQDPLTAFHIGFEMVAFHSWDLGRSLFLRALGSPRRAARTARWLARRFAQLLNDLQVEDLTETGCRLILNWDPTLGLTKDICLLYQGGVAATPLAWGGPPLGLRESACLFQGQPRCILEVSWPPFTWRDRWRAWTLGLPSVRHRVLVQNLELHSRSLSDLDARLRQMKASYQAIVAAAPDGLIEVWPDGTVHALNQAALDLAGLPASQGMHFSRLVEPEDASVLAERLLEGLAGKKVSERYRFRMRNSKKEPLLVEGSFSLLDDPERGRLVVGVLRDVTSEADMARALEEERRRFLCLAEYSPLGLIIISPESRYLYLNPRFTQMLGYTLEEVPTGRDFLRQAFPRPEQRRQVVEAWRSDLAALGLGQLRPRTYRVACKNGPPKDIMFWPVGLDQGEQLVTCVDVTERLAAEKALQDSEARLRTIVEGSPDAILLLDRQRRVLEANQQALALLDGGQALVGGDLLEILPPPHRPWFQDLWQRILAEGRVLVEADLKLATHARRGGRRTPPAAQVEVLAVVLGPELVHLSLRDLGSRRLLEAEARQAARLAGVVELAGAAAHELNQPLTSLLATTELMDIYQDKANLQRLAVKARAEASRLAELVGNLGNLVRYETKEYLGGTRIIDLERAAGQEGQEGGGQGTG